MLLSIALVLVVGEIVGVCIYRHPIQHSLTFENAAWIESYSLTEKKQLSGFRKKAAAVTIDLTEYRFILHPTTYAGTVPVNENVYYFHRSNSKNIPEFFGDFKHNLWLKKKEIKSPVIDEMSVIMPKWHDDPDGIDYSHIRLILSKDFERLCIQEKRDKDLVEISNESVYPAQTEQEADEVTQYLWQMDAF